MRRIIDVGLSITENYQLYTNSAFQHGNAARQVVETSMTQAAMQALAQRDMLIAQGLSRDAAIQSLTTDEAFAEWYAGFTASLAEAVR